jgi:hypothetical protein
MFCLRNCADTASERYVSFRLNPNGNIPSGSLVVMLKDYPKSWILIEHYIVYAMKYINRTKKLLRGYNHKEGKKLVSAGILFCLQ